MVSFSELAPGLQSQISAGSQFADTTARYSEDLGHTKSQRIYFLIGCLVQEIR